MPRRPAPKRIQYVRAVFQAGAAPRDSFESLVRAALRQLGPMSATQINMGTLGTVAIRQRDSNAAPMKLVIAAGARTEHVSTMGFDVPEEQDEDHLQPPPPQRAFKHADAFMLLEDGDLLIILDGSITILTVATYLRQLIELANPGDRAFPYFELKPVTNRDKAAVIAREGIKELRIESTLHAADALLDEHKMAPRTAFSRLRSTLRSFIEREHDENEAQLLAEDWDRLQVTTVIRAKGGAKAKEAVLDSVESIGEELMLDTPPDVQLTVVTRSNTHIFPDELVRIKSANLKRRENTNDLDVNEVWEKLMEYREQLQHIGEWLR